ncbi:MAG: M28 family peptidase [Cytophagaceae bacterium]|jgi:hypothetical protein|nr:M28 family peptidase [Cytophagaceae bacterium]
MVHLSLTRILGSIFVCIILIYEVNSQSAFSAGLSSIQSSDLSQHLHILASDSFAGRGTGTTGQHKAAAYLAQQFQSIGLMPGNPENKTAPYYQPMELVEKRWEKVILQSSQKDYIFLKDFYAYGDIQLPELTTMEIVVAGYGIDDPNYSDYTRLNVQSKAVILFPGEPFKDGKSLLTGTKESSYWANDWRAKAQVALNKGASAVFFVTGKTDEEFYKRLYSIKDHLNQPVIGFTHKKRASAFFIPPSMAAALVKTTNAKLLQYTTGLAQRSSKYPFKKNQITAQVKVIEKKLPTENVIAYIPGSLYPEEVIILTAHYDHLGIENNQIYYGADDDGSGTAALIEIAQAFQIAANLGHRPLRSIVFMPVTAEEKGLMGSEYYTDKPLFSLSNTVANLNIDMIGRMDTLHTDSKYVYIIGSNRLSSALHEINEQANRESENLLLDYRYNTTDDPNRFYFRSDHYNFAKNGIPVIFYFCGVHKDYHQPTDTVEKIDFTKMMWITRLVYTTAWKLANAEQRIQLDVKK